MFQGIGNEAFEFLMALKFNNNRDFFQANRDWYTKSLREPCLELAEALYTTIEKLDSELERRPKRVVSRINRDLRFTNDKTPYRDSMWLAFRRPGAERATTVGVFVDVSTNGVLYGYGYYSENRPVMNAIRRMIRNDDGTLRSIFEATVAQYDYESINYKRLAIPEGIPTSLLPLYTAKNFYVSKLISDFDLIASPELVNAIASGFEGLKPFYDLLTTIPYEPDEDTTVEKERKV